MTPCFTPKGKFIPLIQPYAGVYYGGISWPYKYLYHQQSKREIIYNLQTDPDESQNILKQFQGGPLHLQLQQETAKIMLNDQLIRQDRIWPDWANRLKTRVFMWSNANTTDQYEPANSGLNYIGSRVRWVGSSGDMVFDDVIQLWTVVRNFLDAQAFE